MSDVENDIEIRRSSRSRGVKKNQSALEALKEARRSGKVHRPDVENLVKNVYEEVNDEEYDEIIRTRQAAGFVVDDDGGGYVDHGDDFFEDEEEEDKSVSKDSKAKKKEKKKRESRPGTLNKFFGAGVSNRKVKDESDIKLGDDDLLKNMLADLGDADDDEEISSPMPTFQSNPFARGGIKRAATDGDAITPRPVVKKVALTNRSTPLRQPTLNLKPLPTQKAENELSERNDNVFTRTINSSTVGTAEVKEECVDDYDGGAYDDDDDFDAVPTPVAADPVEVIAVKTAPTHPVKLKAEIKAELEDAETFDNSTSAASQVDNKDDVMRMLNEESWADEVTEEVKVVAGTEEFYQKDDSDQFIRMYWLDAYEDTVKHAGTVYLFGRVMKTKTASASCCVVLKNIQRQVYVLPRASKLVNGVETGDSPTDIEIYEEIKNTLMRTIGVGVFKCKKIQKKFMNNGTVEDKDCSKEVNMFEIRYSSTSPKLPVDLSGETFSAVYNTTTTAMERLIVEQEFMGPGWINISNYVESMAKQSYCDYEFTVNMEKVTNITYNSNDSTPPPPSRVLVLNVLTALNASKTREICMVSALFSSNTDINHPSSNPGNLSRFTLFCKPSTGNLPFNIKDYLTSKGLESKAQSTVNEKALLCLFLAKMQKCEPDIIVGHDLQAAMDLLKSRMQKLGVPNWSRMSRLKRSVNLSSIRNNKAGQWEFTAGRSLMDSRISAMETVRCRSYDLTELCSHILKSHRVEVYPQEIPSKYSDSVSLLNLIQTTWTDAMLSFEIIVRLNALPLYVQITNICGGVLSRTLMGGRAERNEFLLLHAFQKANVIAPNKYIPIFNKKDKKSIKSEASDETPVEAVDDTSSKKAQYSGGLVLEPKKGLYDSLILLLDFNSLYPSIIQEYNICFTTVKHEKDGNELPEAPVSGLPEGILPKEIRVLVDRRRQVKTLMTAPNLPEAKKKQYDIRQTALKLTANSMYGCLGFQNSRFYAKPLAALVTSKGREILMQTKSLVERMGYSVVYGDTDSIMVNTNGVDFTHAKKLAIEIRKQVNQSHKILELGLDGIFKRMLLLKKKKYAALAVNPDNCNEMKKELKGLDIIRRDWSQLARDIGTKVVDHILDPDLSREELISKIRSCLESLRKQLDMPDNDLRMFEISKQLTRNPLEYNDIKSQPHASVALRLNNSGKLSLKSGDIVEYIICEDGSTKTATQRAYHRTEFKDNPDLKPDITYYLSQQVHPVVSRLCAPVDETDPIFIAEALGLDTTGYKRSAAALLKENGPEEANYDLNFDNYDHCEAFSFPCPGTCGSTVHIRSPFDGEGSSMKPSLESCNKCDTPFVKYASYLANLLDNRMSQLVASHLSSHFKCDETVCSYRTAHYQLKWSKEGLDCSKCGVGVLRKEYTAKNLFDQQSFYRQIFDMNSSLSKLKPEEKRTMEARYCATISVSNELCGIVNNYLRLNSYNRVNLAYLFAPMIRKNKALK